LAYYFHWPKGEIFSMNRRERGIWLAQISRIHLMQKEARDKEAWEQAERFLAARAQN
jgi:hypothetical protein